MIQRTIISFLALVFMNFASVAQSTEFKMDPLGFPDFVVTSIDSASQSKLYQSTLNWVKMTYSNPDKVIQTTIENEIIRIQGSKEGLVCGAGLMGERIPYLTRYQIEISFKDGKYKFDVIDVEYFIATAGLGWTSWTASKHWEHYFRDGELKKTYKFYSEVPAYFNSLNESLKNFIVNPSAKKSDW